MKQYKCEDCNAERPCLFSFKEELGKEYRIPIYCPYGLRCCWQEIKEEELNEQPAKNS